MLKTHDLSQIDVKQQQLNSFLKKIMNISDLKTLLSTENHCFVNQTFIRVKGVEYLQAKEVNGKRRRH